MQVSEWSLEKVFVQVGNLYLMGCAQWDYRNIVRLWHEGLVGIRVAWRWDGEGVCVHTY